MQNSTIPSSIQAFFPDAKPFHPELIKPGAALIIDQIAIVVQDIQGAMDLLAAAFGWAPWYPVYGVQGAVGKERQAGLYKLNLAFAKVGSLEVELVQPVEGETPYMAHLKERGIGIFHLRMPADNVGAAAEHCRTLGIQPIWELWDGDGQACVYTNTHPLLGFRLELIRSPV